MVVCGQELGGLINSQASTLLICTTDNTSDSMTVLVMYCQCVNILSGKNLSKNILMLEKCVGLHVLS